MTTGKIYRHYKGGIYELLSLAQLESNNEMMVIYCDIETGQKWVRPQSEFQKRFTEFKQEYKEINAKQT